MIEVNQVEILLIEDNDGDAELAIRALKKKNLANNLLRLHDGEEALNYLFSEKTNVFPKLILLDLKMPKVSGIEVLKRLKSDELRKVIPVVVMTSSKEDRDIIDSYKLGVNAYIVKPVDFAKFSEAIMEVGFFWLVLNQRPGKN
ncbi:response regulator [Cytophagales bacterium WSM2-2]|nr:response regulator [Cytophagales bacterium WSM2-2]